MLNIPKQTYGNGGRPIPKPSKESTIRRKAENRASVEQLKKKAAKEAGASVIVIEDRPVSAKMERMVRERDGDRCCSCGYCGGEVRPDNSIVKTHIDHRIPRAAGIAAGGTNNEENLRVMCDRCNLGKGARRDNADLPPPKPPVSEEDKRLLAEKDAQTNALIAKVRKGKT